MSAFQLPFKSVRDLFEKLKRDAALLEEEVTSDRLFNFVVTGYSMIDWIKNDPSVTADAKTGVNTLYQDQYLKVCGDIATGCKHFSIDRRPIITQSVESKNGFGKSRFGRGAFGTGEETIHIKLRDGTIWTCLDFVTGVLDTWENYLLQHNIISNLELPEVGSPDIPPPPEL